MLKTLSYGYLFFYKCIIISTVWLYIITCFFNEFFFLDVRFRCLFLEKYIRVKLDYFTPMFEIFEILTKEMKMKKAEHCV